MTNPTTPDVPVPAGGTREYLADRYDRLRNCAEILASDPAIENADSFVNGEMLRVFIAELVEQRVLDGLSENDANTVGMLATLNVLKGPAHMAGRISAWLNGDTLGREDDNTWAVCAVLAEILGVYLAASRVKISPKRELTTGGLTAARQEPESARHPVWVAGRTVAKTALAARALDLP